SPRPSYSRTRWRLSTLGARWARCPRGPATVIGGDRWFQRMRSPEFADSTTCEVLVLRQC
ncbi:MAG TPA: hypothetical protein VM487_21445, partial [Phycisphaerae bacterium]|nr:hypothetical protein [Phycisphaerae bacterium]